MARQPFYIARYGSGIELNNADIIHKFGMYIPNNHRMTSTDIEFISNVVNKFARPI